MNEKNEKTSSTELPAKRLQKKLRKVILFLTLLAVAWIFIQFGCHKIDGNYEAITGRFQPGSTIVYDRLFDYHGASCTPSCDKKDANLHRYDFVLYGHETDSGKAWLILKIVGMPGETIEVRESEGKKEIVIAGEYIFDARSDFEIPENGIIPPRTFFIVNHQIKSSFPDSRNFGLVKAEDITGKALAPIGFHIL